MSEKLAVGYAGVGLEERRCDVGWMLEAAGVGLVVLGLRFGGVEQLIHVVFGAHQGGPFYLQVHWSAWMPVFRNSLDVFIRVPVIVMGCVLAWAGYGVTRGRAHALRVGTVGGVFVLGMLILVGILELWSWWNCWQRLLVAVRMPPAIGGRLPLLFSPIVVHILPSLVWCMIVGLLWVGVWRLRRVLNAEGPAERQ